MKDTVTLQSSFIPRTNIDILFYPQYISFGMYLMNLALSDITLTVFVDISISIPTSNMVKRTTNLWYLTPTYIKKRLPINIFAISTIFWNTLHIMFTTMRAALIRIPRQSM